jgi:hypothetical protein
MKRIEKLLWPPFIVFLVLIPFTSLLAEPLSEDRGEEELILVGRITYVQGKVLRYVPEEGDWVVIVKDTPFGLRDALHSERRSRAEIIMPNNTWARIDGDTEIRLIELRTDVTEMAVDSGVARFYNKGFDAVIEARTPFGYVTGPGETSFDVYVGGDSVEVVASKGMVTFVHTPSEKKFEVIAGSSSIVADSSTVTAGEPRLDPTWYAWNNKMDALWAKRLGARGKSAEYLPPQLHDEGYVLDECGRWERVCYNGDYYYFWRPLCVRVGWAPFTAGRWIVWYGDHTWVPCEPFGYLTHHYGSWVFVGGYWYWAPPVCRIRVRIGPPPPPLFPFPFFWCPGRVAWIHYRGRVGWFPLAPWETYYCHRRWGPRAVIVRNGNRPNIHGNINRYKHFRHAVIIDKRNLYRVNSYRKIRITGIHDVAFLKNYRAVPVVNSRVISNYGNSRQKYGLPYIHPIGKLRPPTIEETKRSLISGEQGGKLGFNKPRRDVEERRRGEIAKGNRMKPSGLRYEAVPLNKVKRQPPRKFDEGALKRRTGLPGQTQKPVGGNVQRQWREAPPEPVKKHMGKQERHGQTTRGDEKRWMTIGREPTKKQLPRRKEGSLAITQPRETRGGMHTRTGHTSQKGARGGNRWAN